MRSNEWVDIYLDIKRERLQLHCCGMDGWKTKKWKNDDDDDEPRLWKMCMETFCFRENNFSCSIYSSRRLLSEPKSDWATNGMLNWLNNFKNSRARCCKTTLGWFLCCRSRFCAISTSQCLGIIVIYASTLWTAFSKSNKIFVILRDSLSGWVVRRFKFRLWECSRILPGFSLSLAAARQWVRWSWTWFLFQLILISSERFVPVCAITSAELNLCKWGISFHNGMLKVLHTFR